jgi:hypothetical protein
MIGKLDGHRLVLSESDFDEFLVVCVTLSDWSPPGGHFKVYQAWPVQSVPARAQ